MMRLVSRFLVDYLVIPRLINTVRNLTGAWGKDLELGNQSLEISIVFRPLTRDLARSGLCVSPGVKSGWMVFPPAAGLCFSRC